MSLFLRLSNDQFLINPEKYAPTLIGYQMKTHLPFSIITFAARFNRKFSNVQNRFIIIFFHSAFSNN